MVIILESGLRCPNCGRDLHLDDIGIGSTPTDYKHGVVFFSHAGGQCERFYALFWPLGLHIYVSQVDLCSEIPF